MTYALFLELFLGVPILLLAFGVGRWVRRRHIWAGVLVCGLAFLYTTPWDNYAAKMGLWSFDGHFAPRSHFIGHLPWEEYAFYSLQGALVCLLCVGLARVFKPSDGAEF
jgi:lycopene cyclase domain-containing protein